MKKWLLLCFMTLATYGGIFAQSAKPASSEQKTQAPAPTKKDGTPDMRYKSNKDAAKPATGPTKKDGTPDMRYNANKDAAKTAPATKPAASAKPAAAKPAPAKSNK